MDENISRAAGAAHGQAMTEQRFRGLVEPLGRTIAQRTTGYGRVDGVDHAAVRAPAAG
jgi:FO synthase